MSTESGFSPTCGFVPDGGSCSEKQNVAESSVEGVETRLSWRPSAAFSFDLAHVWSRSEFDQSPSQPLIVGKAFPHSPEHRVFLGARWQVSSALTFSAYYEYWDSQYENAVNTLELPAFEQVRLGLDYLVNEHVSTSISLENVFDTEVVTGLRANGTVSVGRPRSFLASVRLRY
jgi:outer membrane receptor protein involved in Fe transport